MAADIRIKMLNSGIPVVHGNVGFFGVDIESFIIGDAVGFIPTDTENYPRGNITFTGARDKIKIKFSNEERSIRIGLIIPEEYNNINIGNIMIYALHKGTITPFAMIILSEVVTKTNPSSAIIHENYKYPGNRMHININVDYVDADTLNIDYTINVISANFANLPYFGNDYDIPTPDLNPHAQFVVNEMVSLGRRPTVVTKSQEGDAYFASPMFQNIDNPKFGILNSFNSDYHKGERVRWLWGQLYTTPDEKFTGILGGMGYEDDDDTAIVLGGLSYEE